MKALIIYTHPDTAGHNPEILKAVEAQLKKQSADYQILDLYKLKYDPVLHENELYTAGNKNISEENKKYQKLIEESDTLIFIYPIWTYSMPAMLNGFFSKVFTPGFAVEKDGLIPKGLLHQKAIVFMTSGAPKIYYRIVGNTPKKVIKSCLKYCGLIPKIFHIGSCDKLSEKKISKIKKIVDKALGCPCMRAGS